MVAEFLLPYVSMSTSAEPSSSEYRITVVGAGLVGKSAITMQFMQGTFVERYDPTIEDSYRRLIEIDNEACVLDIMDTAGQEEYSALRDQYIQTGEGFLVVVAINLVKSFTTAKQLHERIMRIKAMQKDFPIVLVANKIDLEAERTVAAVELKELATQWGCPMIETSAKMNIKISDAFFTVVRLIKKFRLDHPGTGIKAKRPPKQKSCVIV